MRLDELRQLLRKEPFLPFTLFVTDGRSFEVRHPELVALTQSSAQIGMPGSTAPVSLPEKRIVLAFLHITGYEQSVPFPPTTSN
jgi:hypothetical protein